MKGKQSPAFVSIWGALQKTSQALLVWSDSFCSPCESQWKNKEYDNFYLLYQVALVVFMVLTHGLWYVQQEENAHGHNAPLFLSKLCVFRLPTKHFNSRNPQRLTWLETVRDHRKLSMWKTQGLKHLMSYEDFFHAFCEGPQGATQSDPEEPALEHQLQTCYHLLLTCWIFFLDM